MSSKRKSSDLRDIKYQFFLVIKETITKNKVNDLDDLFTKVAYKVYSIKKMIEISSLFYLVNWLF